MANDKFSLFDVADGITNVDYFVGVRINTDGTKANFRYTPDQIIDFMRKPITALFSNISTDNNYNDTLTDPYFKNAISTIVYSGSEYQIGEDFVQNTINQSITLINGASFANGKKITARI